ncbi:MAG TPA: hypothetical protein VMB72_13805, partial [Acidimicrobiales bacterium]|nr:hypothetical protein [Acidimicrobiales bacterium]
PSTTAGVVTSPASNLAFTGPGPGIGLLGILGGILIVLGFAMLLLVDAPRRAMGRLAYAAPEMWRRIGVKETAGTVVTRLGNLGSMPWKKANKDGAADVVTDPGRLPEAPTVAEPVGVAPAAAGPVPTEPVTPVAEAMAAPTVEAPSVMPSAMNGTPAPTAPGRNLGTRVARMPGAGRGLAQSTARTAVRTAQWLLGR